MWLIDNNTLRLRSVDDETVEKYAILSHTWEAGQEVTFQDMDFAAQARVTHRRGFEKIRATCRQALADGLQYSWVDTCCIDKTSDTKLSEAINSMYRWYEAAEVCYVFLADLVLDQAGGGTQQFDQRLPGCRWFTRGWMLQELIAPRRVKFFDSAWRFCGAKEDSGMLQRLSRITNVPAAVLRAPEEFLPQVLAAQKMSWAAKRQTGAPEDAAYCLLGIFDINMPLIYGEGAHKAFLRLQKEIVKATKDISLLAWEVDEPLEAHGVFAKSPAAFLRSSKMARSDNAPTRDLFGASVVVSELLSLSDIPMVMVEDMVLGETGMDLQETFALPCRDGDQGNVFLPVCRTVDGYYRNSPKLVRRRQLLPNSASLAHRGMDSLYTISTTNHVSLFGLVDSSFSRRVQADNIQSLPLMRINTGPHCDVVILTGYPARRFDSSNQRFLLRNTRRETCMLLLQVCPQGLRKETRLDWGMERGMRSTAQLVAKHQGPSSRFFLLSFKVDTGCATEPLEEDLSRTAGRQWNPACSDVRILALHELVQQRKDISFLDRLDQNPSSEFIIGTCAVNSKLVDSGGLLAKLSSSTLLKIKFGPPLEPTSQNPDGRFALQLELDEEREESDCILM